MNVINEDGKRERNVHISIQNIKIIKQNIFLLFIVRHTQQCGAKLSYATINKATCFNHLGSSSGL